MARKNKSIIQKDCTVCFFKDCTCSGNIEEHHVFFGRGRRKISDREGLAVYLCHEHHQGTNGVHGKNGKLINYTLKEIAQEEWERRYIEEYPYENHAEEAAREAFIRMMERNYL